MQVFLRAKVNRKWKLDRLDVMHIIHIIEYFLGIICGLFVWQDLFHVISPAFWINGDIFNKHKFSVIFRRKAFIILLMSILELWNLYEKNVPHTFALILRISLPLRVKNMIGLSFRERLSRSANQMGNKKYKLVHFQQDEHFCSPLELNVLSYSLLLTLTLAAICSDKSIAVV